jgi:hypothetical protein
MHQKSSQMLCSPQAFGIFFADCTSELDGTKARDANRVHSLPKRRAMKLFCAHMLVSVVCVCLCVCACIRDL